MAKNTWQLERVFKSLITPIHILPEILRYI